MQRQTSKLRADCWACLDLESEEYAGSWWISVLWLTTKYRNFHLPQIEKSPYKLSDTFGGFVCGQQTWLRRDNFSWFLSLIGNGCWTRKNQSGNVNERESLQRNNINIKKSGLKQENKNNCIKNQQILKQSKPLNVKKETHKILKK